MSKFIRVNVTTEGQTEEKFVKKTLADYLGRNNISVTARSVLTSKDRKKSYRGGLVSYEKAKKDILTWLKEDNHSNVKFTTMFDLYALPDDFPGFNKSKGKADPYEKVKIIEEALSKDINDRRFMPYIQLHEFEALLFSKPSELACEYFDKEREIDEFEKILEKSGNPELIDDGKETAPSKRIISLIPEYKGNKTNVAPDIVDIIGMDYLKEKCRHFRDWINKLEKSN